MAHRPPAALAVVVCGAVGLLIGLSDLQRLLVFPLERYQAFARLPRPRAVDWVAGLRPVADTLRGLEGPRIALTVALLIFSLALVAAVINPSFRLLKPPDENPGTGGRAHLDLPRLFRAAAAAVLSFWVMGTLASLAAMLPRRPGVEIWALLLGGLPIWSAFAGSAGPVVHGLLLGVTLYLLWGALAVRSGYSLPELALWGALAGGAAVPGILALHTFRSWLPAFGDVFGLTARGPWIQLMTAGVLLPVIGAAYLGWIAFLFRPRAAAGGLSRACVVAVAFVAAGLLMLHGGNRVLARYDVGEWSLRNRLGLAASPLRRYALVLTADGRSVYSAPYDGSSIGDGRDPIACNGATVPAVERFLDQRAYETALGFRAYVHLFDCASLDWLSTRSLGLSLESLERVGSPIAGDLLLSKLWDSPTVPDNRKVLDALADPVRFTWPAAMGPRWLGRTYLRFGDVARARQYLLGAGLSETELRADLGGVTPLPGGTVRGRMTLRGAATANIRVGLVPADRWQRLEGMCRAFDWRPVLTSAHTDLQGRFEFRDIPQGDYLLVITGGGIGRDQGTPVASPHPRAIRVDRFRENVVLRPFDIRFEAPVTVPGTGIPPGTTAA